MKLPKEASSSQDDIKRVVVKETDPWFKILRSYHDRCFPQVDGKYLFSKVDWELKDFIDEEIRKMDEKIQARIQETETSSDESTSTPAVAPAIAPEPEPDPDDTEKPEKPDDPADSEPEVPATDNSTQAPPAKVAPAPEPEEAESVDDPEEATPSQDDVDNDDDRTVTGEVTDQDDDVDYFIGATDRRQNPQGKSQDEPRKSIFSTLRDSIRD